MRVRDMRKMQLSYPLLAIFFLCISIGHGMIVELSNLYGCYAGELSYKSVCQQPAFLWDKVYTDGTFPVVFQEKDGAIKDIQRNKWQLVAVAGKENHFQVRLCGLCSFGPCCVYWALRKHWTYSELVATYNTADAAVFEFKSVGGRGFMVYACNHHYSCRYEMTWEYLSYQPKVKWISFQHYRNEGVKWSVKIRRII